MNRDTLCVLLGVLAAAAFLGCRGLGDQMRRHTYPPNFQYVTDEQLSSAMWQLAAHVEKLDRLLDEPDPVDEQRRQRVLQELRGMENATKQLGTEGWRSNHPLIDANLEMFRGDILLAREGVEAEPPNYFMTGVLYGACVYCHGGTRSGR